MRRTKKTYLIAKVKRKRAFSLFHLSAGFSIRVQACNFDIIQCVCVYVCVFMCVCMYVRERVMIVWDESTRAPTCTCDFYSNIYYLYSTRYSIVSSFFLPFLPPFVATLFYFFIFIFLIPELLCLLLLPQQQRSHVLCNFFFSYFSSLTLYALTQNNIPY